MAEIKIIGSDFSIPLSLHYAPSIKAGIPTSSEELPDMMDFNKDFIKHPLSTFYGLVDGDSMIDAGICNGDLAVIDKSLEAENGDVVVAYVNNEFTIKFLDLTHKDEGYIELRPANKNFKPIKIDELDDFEVWGVVVYTIKNWKR